MAVFQYSELTLTTHLRHMHYVCMPTASATFAVIQTTTEISQLIIALTQRMPQNGKQLVGFEGFGQKVIHPRL